MQSVEVGEQWSQRHLRELRRAGKKKGEDRGSGHKRRTIHSERYVWVVVKRIEEGRGERSARRRVTGEERPKGKCHMRGKEGTGEG